jgi:CelD/BcsL family acetyltransferase involved in cellulose biosynthesis
MPRPTPFLLHAWLAAWWRWYGRNRQLAVHTARRSGRLVAALPLTEEPGDLGISIARFVGAPDSTFADVLLAAGEDAETARLLLRTAACRHGLLQLFTLGPESRLAGLVSPRALHPRARAPVMDIGNGWDETFARKTSSKRRALYRRRWRQLNGLGHVDVAIALDSADVEAALEDAFLIHARRWKGRGDVSHFADDTGRAFNRDALTALARREMTRIITLRCNGEPIAFSCNLALGDRMYVYRLGFDPRYAQWSPGILTTLESLRIGAAEGIRTVEFLRGTERYKVELADMIDVLSEAVVSGGGIRSALGGHVLMGGTRIRRATGRARRRARDATHALIERGGRR